MKTIHYKNGNKVLYRDMTPEEIELNRCGEEPEVKDDTELLSKRLKDLEDQNQLLIECIIEMADIIYA